MMGASCPPFVFRTERRLVRLTGRSATNLETLIGHLEDVSGAVVFYHTHHQYLSHHFERPVYYNDFAAWVRVALQDAALAEQLAAIDMLRYSAVRPLREALLGVLRTAASDPARPCPPGSEFHFCESQSFVVRTGLSAASAPEFFAILPHVTTVSLFFHFFEARLRLGRDTNDFTAWLAASGEPAIADAIELLDPYTMTLGELKQEIVAIGRKAGL